ncbi:MAG TPA: DNA repair protein RecN [Candidatus Gastranaerophilaceae bacterium]|nr:DNA repair protein RecN [Candidatus Gastranaerophilaceae bacterium]HPT41189.1 DNA repair protein RecN [Candidatus Gastranaerophilaceae bacterium]
MIKQILIKDYILIDELLVNFDNGLNVITGETGAGKSIIINAIDLVFAPRVSKDVIKTGCEKALIELVLDYSKQDLNQIFEENGIDNFGNEIVISKEISENAVRSRVNGTLVNQEFIKILKDKFLDIHSQHQTYAFLQPKFHINLLDAYAKDSYGNDLNEYKIIFKQYEKLCNELESAKSLSNATENQIEFLKFQIKEIEDAQINDENEYEILKNELNVLENAEKLKELTGTSYWSMNGDENSILGSLGLIKMNISKAAQMDGNLAFVEGNLISAAEVLSEISAALRDYSQNLENDTEKLNTIQERIFFLDKIKRKYGNTLSEVMQTLTRLRQEYDQIEFSTQNIEELELKISELREELSTKASVLSENRKYFAQSLSASIVEKLENLELPKVRFEILVEELHEGVNAGINSNGCDRVEFLISTNVSEDLKPLAKVASGGEISRVMLAIKTIFAQNDDIDTVIFDEIDTGISGKTAQSVADEISELAKYHQIILITHQAIIASKANKHFYVTKSQDNDITSVLVYTLEGDNRVKALAELAGGEINDQSIDFARSLLYQPA